MGPNISISTPLHCATKANATQHIIEKVDKLNNKLSELRKKLSVVTLRNQELKKKTSEFISLQLQEDDYKDQISNLTTKHEADLVQIAKFKSGLTDANHHNSNLQRQLSQLKEQVKQITTTTVDIEKSKKDQNTIQSLQAKEKLLIQKLEAKDKIISQLQQDLGKQSHKKEAKKEREAKLEALLKKEKQNQEDFESELQHALHEKRKLEQEIQEIKTTLGKFSER